MSKILEPKLKTLEELEAEEESILDEFDLLISHKDIRGLSLGEVIDLQNYLVRNFDADMKIDPQKRRLVSEAGYHWREKIKAGNRMIMPIYPEVSLYLETIARLNEIHKELNKEKK